MIPKTSYPTALKNVLKAGPSVVVFTGFGVLFTTLLHGVLYHPHERIERYFMLIINVVINGY